MWGLLAFVLTIFLGRVNINWRWARMGGGGYEKLDRKRVEILIGWLGAIKVNKNILDL